MLSINNVVHISYYYNIIIFNRADSITLHSILAAFFKCHSFISILKRVVFGQLVTTFTTFTIVPPSPQLSDVLVDRVNHFTLYFIYLAIGTFISTYIYMGCFVHVGENIGFRLRREYLRAVLRQNIAWFDTEGAGSVTTRINTDTLLVQDAVSEKVSLCFSQVCTTIAGKEERSSK